MAWPAARLAVRVFRWLLRSACPVPRWVHWGTLVRYLGHPQYLGLILIVLGLNIQSPTLPMFLMAPVLIGMNAVWQSNQHGSPSVKERGLCSGAKQ